jgi:hypothetical protein
VTPRAGASTQPPMHHATTATRVHLAGRGLVRSLAARRDVFDKILVLLHTLGWSNFDLEFLFCV